MARAQPVDAWVSCFAGATQNEGRVTGIDEIQDSIWRRIHESEQGAHVRVLMKHWRDSPKGLAERIWNRRPDTIASPRVVLIGYSYGGYTAVQTARELQKRGIDVETLLLIDPVWRPGWWPSLSSLWHHWIIDVPTNVKTVYRYYQEENTPRGHKVRVDDTTTVLIEQQIRMTHQYIDDAWEIKQKALEVAAALLTLEGPRFHV